MSAIVKRCCNNNYSFKFSEATLICKYSKAWELNFYRPMLFIKKYRDFSRNS